MKRVLSFIIILILFCTSAYAGEIKALKRDDPLPFGEDEELMYVYFLGIGACDSFLIKCGGEAMLIDAGTNQSARYVIGYLQGLGVSRLNYAVNTHPHDDHIDGFNKVFASVPVDKFFICYPKDFTSNMREALKSAEMHNVEVVSIDTDYDLSFGGNKIKSYREINTNINHSSLAMRLEYGDCSVFFSADITSRACTAMAEKYGTELKSDILKMPHHGLTTIKYAFLKSVDPQVCIITNGNNKSVSDNVYRLKKWKYPRLFTLRTVYEFVTNGEYWTCRDIFTNPEI